MTIKELHECKAQPKHDLPDLIAGALGVSRGTAYDLMREALADQRKQVGDSRFESWYSEDFDPKGKGTKQQMREAYEAGMNDPSSPALAPQPAQHPKAKAIAECLAVLRPAVKGKFPHEQALEELVGYIAAPQPAQPQQKPFTHYRHYDNGLQDWADEKTIPLYTDPPASKPLTDEQWQIIADTLGCIINRKQKDAIEAARGCKEGP